MIEEHDRVGICNKDNSRYDALSDILPTSIGYQQLTLRTGFPVQHLAPSSGPIHLCRRISESSRSGWSPLRGRSLDTERLWLVSPGEYQV